MERINNFKFTLNVTRESYENKQDALACLSTAGAKAIGRNKMAFEEKTVTVDEFLNLAVSGYAFCNRYQFDTTKKYWIENKKHQKYLMYPTYQRGVNTGAMKVCFKRDEFFRSAQVIFVDVDFTNYQTVQDYIDSLKFQPTCVYMSFSDNKEKHGITSRRFHLVYIFSDELNKEQFINAANALTQTIIEDTKEEMDDDCGTRLSQYMNGCYGNSEVYNTNIIYSYNDLLNIINNNINNIIVEEENKSTTYYSVSENEGHQENEDNKPSESLISERLINDMERLSYDDFMRYNRHKYNKFYRQEGNYWINGEYQYIESEDFFSLYFNINTVKDGSKRRKKLFERMCLRRIINPGVDADTLLFNAYEDRERFFDNSDGVLSIECLVRNVENAMKLTLEEIEEHYSENLAYLRSKRPKSNIIFKPFVPLERRTEILKNLRWEKLNELYDTSISLSKNLINLNKNGFSIGKDALYSYCKEHGICTSPNKLSDEEIMVLLDTNLSVRKNLEILKNSDIKIGKDRINKLLNILKNNINNNIYNNNIYNNIEDDVDEYYSTTYYSESEIQGQYQVSTKSSDNNYIFNEGLPVTPNNYNMYSNI